MTGVHEASLYISDKWHVSRRIGSSPISRERRNEVSLVCGIVVLNWTSRTGRTVLEVTTVCLPGAQNPSLQQVRGPSPMEVRGPWSTKSDWKWGANFAMTLPEECSGKWANEAAEKAGERLKRFYYNNLVNKHLSHREPHTSGSTYLFPRQSVIHKLITSETGRYTILRTTYTYSILLSMWWFSL